MAPGDAVQAPAISRWVVWNRNVVVDASITFGPVLLGRSDEREALKAVVDAARAGMSGVLVLRGDAGIGKTALLASAADAAEGLHVARVAGVESEMGLGFAGLHRLLVPYLDGMDELPAPQRDALGAAFGLLAGPPPDRFLVSLAALTLLADRAAVDPMLCLIDDAQWLDRESIDVLAFVARRLHADGLALVFAVRDPTEQPLPLDGLPLIVLHGLQAGDARALLEASVPGSLDQRVAARLIVESSGNPLALVELSAELTSGQLAGGASLPELLPLGRRLETRYLRQVQTLPPTTQLTLLVAAAESEGDPGAVYGAIEELGIAADAADLAEARGLLTAEPAGGVPPPADPVGCLRGSGGRRSPARPCGAGVGDRSGAEPGPAGVSPRRSDDRTG